MRGAAAIALLLTLGGGLESSAAQGRAPAETATAVTVRTDAPRYRQGQTIVVTIRNGLAAPIAAMTGRASCSIVSLDRRTATGWIEVRNCYAGVPPVEVRIASGNSVRVRLRDRLQPSTYRARLEYRVRGRTAKALSRALRVDR
jgi:FtsP/CotA-like multicopper oxidase with cupredoxin domain